MPKLTLAMNFITVAPRKGCVSRNYFIFMAWNWKFVAPRKGCVSRNVYKLSLELPPLELHPARGV